MDSSNSGSFQSSSGGAGDNNDEYDSTTTTTTQSQSQSISSSFFNPPPSTNNLLFNQLNHHHHLLQPPTNYPQPHPPSDNTTTTFFNPSSAPPFSSNPLQDPASAWTGTMRPDQINLPDFASSYTTINPADTQTKTPRGSDHHQQHQIGVAVKNPKKRTRASRRAPTTVLTTDTTNFRQMVQEFTGIPTAPFTAAAPFSRRLDLFRPSPSQPPPFLNSAANILDSAHTINNNNTSSAATTSSNYHFSPSTMNNFQKQPSSFLDSQNPMFSFQSLLQNSVPQQPKRWGTTDQDGKLEGVLLLANNNTTSQNNIIGGSNSKLENMLQVTSRSSSGGGGGGDQVQVLVVCDFLMVWHSTNLRILITGHLGY